MPDFKVANENVSFWLRVKPRSPRERLALDASGESRLELHASATEGQANAACIGFFARALHLPQGCIVILSGQRARRKLLRVSGRAAEVSIRQIEALAASPGEGRNG